MALRAEIFTRFGNWTPTHNRDFRLMKSHPKRLIKRIQSALERPDDLDQLQGLAVEYAAMCALVNRRLEQIRAFLEKGQPVVAMELAESTYPLIELTEYLIFPEEAAWRELLKTQHLPSAERIVTDDVQLLRQMYEQHKAESPLLYRDYRAAVLRDEEDKARRILRALVRLDAGDANAREELNRLERKAIRQGEADLAALMEQNQEEAVLEKLREMEQFPWTVGPAGEIWQRALDFRNQIQERHARDRVAELLNEWEAAIRAEDITAAEERAAEFAAYANQFDLSLSEDETDRYRQYSAWLRDVLQQKDRYELAEGIARQYDALRETLAGELIKRKNSPLRLQKLKSDLESLWAELLQEQKPGDVEQSHLTFLRQTDHKLNEILAQQRQLAIGVIFVGAAALFISFSLMFKLQRERQLEADLAGAFAAENQSEVAAAVERWETRRLPIIRTGNAITTFEAARSWLTTRTESLKAEQDFLLEAAQTNWELIDNTSLMNRRTRILRPLALPGTSDLEEARQRALTVVEAERERRISEGVRRTQEIKENIQGTLNQMETLIRSGILPESIDSVIRGDMDLLPELHNQLSLLDFESQQLRETQGVMENRIRQLIEASRLLFQSQQLPTLRTENAFRASLQQLASSENALLDATTKASSSLARWNAAPPPSGVWLRPRFADFLPRLQTPVEEFLTPTAQLPPESSRLARFLEQEIISRIWQGELESKEGSISRGGEVIFFIGPPPATTEQSIGVRTEITQILQRASLADLSDTVIQQTPETMIWTTDLDGNPLSGTRLRKSDASPEAVFFRDLANRLRFNERQGTLGRPIAATLDELLARSDLDPGFVAFIAEFLVGLMLERPDRWQTWLMPSLQVFQSELNALRRTRSGLAIWLELPRDAAEKRELRILFETYRNRPFLAEAQFFWSALEGLTRQPLQFIGGTTAQGQFPADRPLSQEGVILGLNSTGQWDFLGFNEIEGWAQSRPALPFSPLYLFAEDPRLLLQGLRGFGTYPGDFLLQGDHLPYRLP
jgi:dephospho-CoA kinase